MATSSKTSKTSPAASAKPDAGELTLDMAYVPARLPTGTVRGVWGSVMIRTVEGELRPLEVGDLVRKGDVIMTAQDGIVELDADGNRLARLPAQDDFQSLAVAPVDLNQLEPTAAGEEPAGSLNRSDSVLRVNETTTGTQYDFGQTQTGTAPTAFVAAVQQGTVFPTLQVSSPVATESDGFAVFTVALSGASDVDTSLSFALTSGAAGDLGVDFGSRESNNLQVSTDGGATWIDATTTTLLPGQSSVLVRTPLVDDTLNEAAETFTLVATTTAGNTLNGNATGTATITDNDAQPSLSLSDVSVDEAAGTATFTVTLSAASGQNVSVRYDTVDASATAATATASGDYTANSGTLTFAPGETTRTVTVAITDDTVFESAETFQLQLSQAVNASLSTAAGVGTIVDNDTAPRVASVEPGIAGTTDDAVAEGTPLVYNVSLTNASATPATYAFNLGNAVTGPGLASAADFGAPTFSNGVTYDPATGLITVPANVAAFTVTVPTVADSLYEPGAAEALPLTVGGITATGLITDANTAPTIRSVEPGAAGTADDTAPEGSSLVYNVGLSNASTTPTTFAFALGGGTASATDFGAPTFSNGVTYDPATGLITVPANVTAFAVTVPALADGLYEPGAAETLPLAIGGVTATGLITDADVAPTIRSVEPGAAGTAGDTAPEGSSLVYNVGLSNASASPTTFAFNLGGGTASATDFGAPTFSNGVTFDATTGLITVPANVTAFTVTVPALADGLYEPGAAETLPLAIGGVTATGLITDADVAPTIRSVEPGAAGTADDTAPEGSSLVYNVGLSNASTTPTTFAFALGGGTASATDFGAPTFSNGVTYDPATGLITVPANVTAFTVTVPALADGLYEPGAAETLPLAIGGVTATGLITDTTTAPTVTSVEPGAAGTADDSVVEGTGAGNGGVIVFNVALSNASTVAQSYAFTLGGTGVNPVDAADQAAPVFSNGVTYDAIAGLISVPAGVTGFTVSITATPDALAEANEGLQVTVGGLQGTATLTNDDFAPVLAQAQTTSTGPEDQAQTGNVLTGNASDANGDALVVSSYTVGGLTAVAGTALPLDGVGTLTINPNGSFNFTPAANYNGAVPEATFTVSDGTNSTTGTLAISITPVNDAPVLAGDLQAVVAEGGTYALTAADLGYTDVDNTAAEVTFTISAPTNGVVTVNGVTATTFSGTQLADGLVSFVHDGSETLTATFNVSVEDGNQDLSTPVASLFSLTVTPVNDAPVVGLAAPLSLSEEGLLTTTTGLPLGLPDTAGTPDTTDAVTFSGTLSITDSDSPALAATLTPPATALTSGGVALVWTGSGTTASPLEGRAGSDGPLIITATIASNGSYAVTLDGPVDHPATNVEDALAVTFGISVTDGLLTSTGSLTVNIEDDSPAVITPQTTTVALNNTNLMIVLDLSGSMNGFVTGTSGATRLDIAKSSITQLIDAYDRYGDVMVRLVTFSSGAAERAPVWLSAADAKSLLAGLIASGNTNYDAALTTAQSAYADGGKLASAQNLSYFFSDGEPNVPTGSIGVNAAEEAAWTGFLDTNDITSFAIGLGTGVSPTALNPIAYNGAAAAGAQESSALIATSFTDLNTVLNSTIPVSQTGQLVVGGTIGAGGQVGADGGSINTLTLDGITYTYTEATATVAAQVAASDGRVIGTAFDPVTNSLTVDTTAQGRFVVDLDGGSYSYLPPAGLTAGITEVLNYTVRDGDGDTVASSVTIAVNPSIATTLAGTDAGNALTGTASADAIRGFAGDDTILGGDGNDLIVGGSGNDLLTGGLGSDVFAWNLTDRGTTAAPARDTITDFNAAASSAGGDILDLRDLLAGEHSGLGASALNLGSYLHFNDVSAGSTVIDVTSTGVAGTVDQQIVLENLDLRSALGLTAAATDAAIISELLTRGKLVVDGN